MREKGGQVRAARIRLVMTNSHLPGLLLCFCFSGRVGQTSPLPDAPALPPASGSASPINK